MMHITEDTPPDMLAGAMDLTVHLPNGRSVKMSVERCTPMMDVLMQITSAHHLQLSGYVIEALGMAPSSEHGDKILPYKPNTPIGTLDTQHIRVVQKARTLPLPKNIPPGHQPFESTFRLKVHLPRKQLFVSRVSMNVLLEDIMRKVCDEKNLDPSKYEFRHPDNQNEVLDPKLTLEHYKVTEIYVVSRGSSRLSQAFSASDIMALRKDEERKHSKSSGGVFNLIFKRGKTSNGSGSLSSDNRSISPTHSDDSRSVTPPAIQQQIIKTTSGEKPKAPQRKRRPAPKPPQPREEPKQAVEAPTENPKKNENGLTICHSRNSSDSSGYHEASILSDNANTSLPRRPQTAMIISEDAGSRNKLNGEHSKSTSNLATMSLQSKSTSSLAFAGRKKKAPPPPPVLKTASSVTNLEKASPVVASPVEKQGKSKNRFSHPGMHAARARNDLEFAKYDSDDSFESTEYLNSSANQNYSEYLDQNRYREQTCSGYNQSIDLTQKSWANYSESLDQNRYREQSYSGYNQNKVEDDLTQKSWVSNFNQNVVWESQFDNCEYYTNTNTSYEDPEDDYWKFETNFNKSNLSNIRGSFKSHSIEVCLNEDDIAFEDITVDYGVNEKRRLSSTRNESEQKSPYNKDHPKMFNKFHDNMTRKWSKKFENTLEVEKATPKRSTRKWSKKSGSEKINKKLKTGRLPSTNTADPLELEKKTSEKKSFAFMRKGRPDPKSPVDDDFETSKNKSSGEKQKFSFRKKADDPNLQNETSTDIPERQKFSFKKKTKVTTDDPNLQNETSSTEIPKRQKFSFKKKTKHVDLQNKSSPAKQKCSFIRKAETDTKSPTTTIKSSSNRQRFRFSRKAKSETTDEAESSQEKEKFSFSKKSKTDEDLSLKTKFSFSKKSESFKITDNSPTNSYQDFKDAQIHSPELGQFPITAEGDVNILQTPRSSIPSRELEDASIFVKFKNLFTKNSDENCKSKTVDEDKSRSLGRMKSFSDLIGKKKQEERSRSEDVLASSSEDHQSVDFSSKKSMTELFTRKMNSEDERRSKSADFLDGTVTENEGAKSRKLSRKKSFSDLLNRRKQLEQRSKSDDFLDETSTPQNSNDTSVSLSRKRSFSDLFTRRKAIEDRCKSENILHDEVKEQEIGDSSLDRKKSFTDLFARKKQFQQRSVSDDLLEEASGKCKSGSLGKKSFSRRKRGKSEDFLESSPGEEGETKNRGLNRKKSFTDLFARTKHGEDMSKSEDVLEKQCDDLFKEGESRSKSEEILEAEGVGRKNIFTGFFNKSKTHKSRSEFFLDGTSSENNQDDDGVHEPDVKDKCGEQTLNNDNVADDNHKSNSEPFLDGTSSENHQNLDASQKCNDKGMKGLRRKKSFSELFTRRKQCDEDKRREQTSYNVNVEDDNHKSKSEPFLDGTSSENDQNLNDMQKCNNKDMKGLRRKKSFSELFSRRKQRDEDKRGENSNTDHVEDNSLETIDNNHKRKSEYFFDGASSENDKNLDAMQKCNDKSMKGLRRKKSFSELFTRRKHRDEDKSVGTSNIGHAEDNSLETIDDHHKSKSDSILDETSSENDQNLDAKQKRNDKDIMGLRRMKSFTELFTRRKQRDEDKSGGPSNFDHVEDNSLETIYDNHKSKSEPFLDGTSSENDQNLDDMQKRNDKDMKGLRRKKSFSELFNRRKQRNEDKSGGTSNINHAEDNLLETIDDNHKSKSDYFFDGASSENDQNLDGVQKRNDKDMKRLKRKKSFSELFTRRRQRDEDNGDVEDGRKPEGEKSGMMRKNFSNFFTRKTGVEDEHRSESLDVFEGSNIDEGEEHKDRNIKKGFEGLRRKKTTSKNYQSELDEEDFEKNNTEGEGFNHSIYILLEHETGNIKKSESQNLKRKKSLGSLFGKNKQSETKTRSRSDDLLATSTLKTASSVDQFKEISSPIHNLEETPKTSDLKKASATSDQGFMTKIKNRGKKTPSEDTGSNQITAKSEKDLKAKPELKRSFMRRFKSEINYVNQEESVSSNNDEEKASEDLINSQTDEESLRIEPKEETSFMSRFKAQNNKERNSKSNVSKNTASIKLQEKKKPNDQKCNNSSRMSFMSKFRSKSVSENMENFEAKNEIKEDKNTRNEASRRSFRSRIRRENSKATNQEITSTDSRNIRRNQNQQRITPSKEEDYEEHTPNSRQVKAIDDIEVVTLSPTPSLTEVVDGSKLKKVRPKKVKKKSSVKMYNLSPDRKSKSKFWKSKSESSATGETGFWKLNPETSEKVEGSKPHISAIMYKTGFAGKATEVSKTNRDCGDGASKVVSISGDRLDQSYQDLTTVNMFKTGLERYCQEKLKELGESENTEMIAKEFVNENCKDFSGKKENSFFKRTLSFGKGNKQPKGESGGGRKEGSFFKRRFSFERKQKGVDRTLLENQEMNNSPKNLGDEVLITPTKLNDSKESGKLLENQEVNKCRRNLGVEVLTALNDSKESQELLKKGEVLQSILDIHQRSPVSNIVFDSKFTSYENLGDFSESPIHVFKGEPKPVRSEAFQNLLKKYDSLEVPKVVKISTRAVQEDFSLTDDECDSKKFCRSDRNTSGVGKPSKSEDNERQGQRSNSNEEAEDFGRKVRNLENKNQGTPASNTVVTPSSSSLITRSVYLNTRNLQYNQILSRAHASRNAQCSSSKISSLSEDVACTQNYKALQIFYHKHADFPKQLQFLHTTSNNETTKKIGVSRGDVLNANETVQTDNHFLDFGQKPKVKLKSSGLTNPEVFVGNNNLKLKHSKTLDDNSGSKIEIKDLKSSEIVAKESSFMLVNSLADNDSNVIDNSGVSCYKSKPGLKIAGTNSNLNSERDDLGNILETNRRVNVRSKPRSPRALSKNANRHLRYFSKTCDKRQTSFDNYQTISPVGYLCFTQTTDEIFIKPPSDDESPPSSLEKSSRKRLAKTRNFPNRKFTKNEEIKWTSCENLNAVDKILKSCNDNFGKAREKFCPPRSKVSEGEGVGDGKEVLKLAGSKFPSSYL